MGPFAWPWIVLALVNARLAGRKDRSGLNWFVVSLFLGPFATVLVLLWPRLPASGASEWTSGQLVSGGAVALAAACLCAFAATAFGGGHALWALCLCCLVGLGVFVWLFLRMRAT